MQGERGELLIILFLSPASREYAGLQEVPTKGLEVVVEFSYEEQVSDRQIASAIANRRDVGWRREACDLDDTIEF